MPIYKTDVLLKIQYIILLYYRLEFNYKLMFKDLSGDKTKQTKVV